MFEGVLLFADKLPPTPGGMEMHAGAFIDYFSNHEKFPLLGLVQATTYPDLSPSLLFFNSGRWIEELQTIKKLYPDAKMIYRTGGNEILKAPLTKNAIASHKKRQQFWVDTLNEHIDLLITNSEYTEGRLIELGTKVPFFRSVGGVTIPQSIPQKIEKTCFFSAARFVPYKNHDLLIDAVAKLLAKGHSLELRFAGDGPLLISAIQQVQELGISDHVTFLGAIDNRACLEEVSKATAYIQLSSEKPTKVEGGSYIHAEGMGRSILEAISVGTYVIAGKGGALPEIITKERGKLVELDSEISTQLEEVLPGIPQKLEPTTEYSWSHVFRKYEETFQTTLSH